MMQDTKKADRLRAYIHSIKVIQVIQVIQLLITDHQLKSN